MRTRTAIVKELKDVPESNLDEVYQLVHSFVLKAKKSQATKKKILSFAGAFADMSNEDYAQFVRKTKETRKNLFNRKFDL